jgi:hypothetical protein
MNRFVAVVEQELASREINIKRVGLKLSILTRVFEFADRKDRSGHRSAPLLMGHSARKEEL